MGAVCDLRRRPSLPWQQIFAAMAANSNSNPQVADATPYYNQETYSAEDSVGYLIAALRTRLFRALDLEFEKHDFTAAQWPILRAVADGATPTAADLCRRLSYDTGSMTRMLARLEQKGVIVREPSAADRRLVQLKITPAGRKMHRKLREGTIRVLNQLVGGFEPQEVRQLHAQLLRMQANLAGAYHHDQP
jgi:MarR family transcriptional regulator, multiple antibiotic resistance protein MarR